MSFLAGKRMFFFSCFLLLFQFVVTSGLSFTESLDVTAKETYSTVMIGSIFGAVKSRGVCSDHQMSKFGGFELGNMKSYCPYGSQNYGESAPTLSPKFWADQQTAKFGDWKSDNRRSYCPNCPQGCGESAYPLLSQFWADPTWCAIKLPLMGQLDVQQWPRPALVPPSSLTRPCLDPVPSASLSCLCPDPVPTPAMAAPPLERPPHTPAAFLSPPSLALTFLVADPSPSIRPGATRPATVDPRPEEMSSHHA